MFRGGLPRHLLQWAFGAGTDRREATLVMQFVAGLMDDPDVGKPVPPEMTGLLGVEDVLDIRRDVPDGTTTEVMWGFDPMQRSIEIIAPGVE